MDNNPMGGGTSDDQGGQTPDPSSAPMGGDQGGMQTPTSDQPATETPTTENPATESPAPEAPATDVPTAASSDQGDQGGMGTV